MSKDHNNLQKKFSIILFLNFSIFVFVYSIMILGVLVNIGISKNWFGTRDMTKNRRDNNPSPGGD